MDMTTLVPWAIHHPAVALLTLTAVAVVVAWVGRRTARNRKEHRGRRTPAAVIAAALAAIGCTAYSADTSWRFAADHLDMHSVAERVGMFGAAELALFAVALMARQNLRTQGAPGAPGVLVWVITGVQVIPAFAESGLIGGIVRAFVGPVLAALLWHLAMGIELRHAKPGADSQSLPSIIAREARERVLSRLGLAQGARDAEQITRDRWTVKAVSLAARMTNVEPGSRRGRRLSRRLSVAVGRAEAGTQPVHPQRQKLLDLLAARRHAASLATIDLPSPWTPSTTLDGVTAGLPEWPPEPVTTMTDDLTARNTSGVTTSPVTEPTTRATTPAAAQPNGQVTASMTSEITADMTTPVTTGITSETTTDVTAPVAAATTTQPDRRVVTGTVLNDRPATDLRKAARRLNRASIKATKRPVSIDALRTELNLSRREATELRRQVVVNGSRPVTAAGGEG